MMIPKFLMLSEHSSLNSLKAHSSQSPIPSVAPAITTHASMSHSCSCLSQHVHPRSGQQVATVTMQDDDADMDSEGEDNDNDNGEGGEDKALWCFCQQ